MGAGAWSIVAAGRSRDKAKSPRRRIRVEQAYPADAAAGRAVVAGRVASAQFVWRVAQCAIYDTYAKLTMERR